MNTQSANAPSPFANDDDEIDLGHILDVLYDGRWWIAAITLSVALLGTVYAIMAKPIYRANVLIQVEDAGNVSNMLSQVMPLIEGKAASTAEIEIIRSRMVVSRAADQLRLHIHAQPLRVPLIGGWMAREATGLSEPGFLGLGGYVWGAEEIEVSAFNVPSAWVGKVFTITQGQGKQFTLHTPDGDALQGQSDQANTWSTPLGAIELQIAHIQGKTGAKFEVTSSSRLAVTENLQKNLQVNEKGKQSNVIEVGLEGGDPVAIASILNTIGQVYVRQNIDRKAEEAGNTLTFLDKLLPQIRQELETAEGRYNTFRNTSGTVNLTAEGSALLEQTVSAQTQLLELRQKRLELLSRFTPEHPSVQTLDSQLAQAQAQAEKIGQQSRQLPKLEQETLRLTRDVKVNNELYANLLNNAQSLKLIKAGQVGNVRVVDTAVVAEQPIKPARTFIVLVSLLLGALVGIGVVYLRKMMHGGLDDPNAIERRLGLTVYATIPHSDKQVSIFNALKNKAKNGASKSSLLSSLDSGDPAIESLRSLRTALQFAMLDAPNKLLMITGPTPGLGKSFISANLANVLASGGKRILLIDADLRKGYLNDYFGRARGHGLSDLISGQKTLEDVIHRAILPNLDLLTTGPLPPNPAELLMNERLADLLQTLGTQYDHILIDSPPVLVVSDAAVLGRLVGASFLVAREGQTTLGELEEAHKRLAQSGVQVKGVLYNDIQARPSRYGSKYSYRYSHYSFK